MKIALCTDENFVSPALVCIVSILENNNLEKPEIHILTEGISNKSHNQFKKLEKLYDCEIEVITIKNSEFDNLLTVGRYPRSMYLRFLLPEVLKDASRVLYLDCDIMVRKSLKPIFETDLTDKACAVVYDQECDDVIHQNRLHLDHPYFNSGVMLMNLDEWRRNDYATELIKFIENNPDKCQYPDQDGLNKMLGSRVRYIDLKYNVQEMWLTMPQITRFHYSKAAELEAAKRDPVIVHFNAELKPWYIECRNPYKGEYLKYANLHSFIGFNPRRHYSRIYWKLDAEIQRMVRWQKRFIRK